MSNLAKRFTILVSFSLLAITSSFSPSFAQQAPKFYYAKTFQLLAKGKVDQAYILMSKALKLYPDNAPLLMMMGRVYKNRLAPGDHNKAKISFARAVNVDPEYGPGFFHLAHMSLMDGQFKQAYKYADRAVKCKKADAEAYKYRALALSGLGKQKEALADINLFLKKMPNFPDGLKTKAEILLMNKQYKEAAAIYEQLLKKQFVDSLCHRVAYCYEKTGDFDKAANSYSQILSRNKVDELALLRRAKAYEQQKKMDKALKDYSAAIKASPSPSSYKARAELYKKIGKTDLAKRDLKLAKDAWDKI